MVDGPDFPRFTGGDEPELPLAGLDADRPLPAELQARLEAALLAAVAGGFPVAAEGEPLDAPRPLPEPLRARLEAALLAETAAPPTASAASEAAAAADSPEAAGAAGGAGFQSTTGGGPGPYLASGTTGGAPAARGAPAAASRSGAPAGKGAAVAPLERRRRKAAAWWSAVAAVLVLLLGVAGLANVGGNGSRRAEVAGAPTTTGAPASVPSGAGVSREAPSPPPAATATPDGPAGTGTTRGTRPARPSPTMTGPAPVVAAPPTTPPVGPAPTSPTGGSGTQSPPVQTDRGPAPPFYDSGSQSDASNPPAMTSEPTAASPSAGSGQQGAAPQKSTSPAAPLRVGVVPGDAAQEAGFRAYVNRLNQNGGVAGHAIELVTVGPGSPAANLIATANLSAQPVAGPGGAPSWASGPLLETLGTPESLLPGNGAVFSFAGPPERQGHLVADAVFPSKAPAGTKAVIYTPAAAGPLRDVVPEAIKALLKERGVIVDVVTYDPAAHKPLTPADAAFISLDPSAARAWVADARAAGYRPAAGVGGIFSLADEALLADLPEGARVVSPYLVPGGAEGQAIRSEGAGTSASVLHGWATAKSLAAAIWRTGADTPAEVQAALEGLSGWSSGLAPAYETRPGTRSRTPEGVLFQVQSGVFIQQGGFRRDSRSPAI